MACRTPDSGAYCWVVQTLFAPASCSATIRTEGLSVRMASVRTHLDFNDVVPSAIHRAGLYAPGKEAVYLPIIPLTTLSASRFVKLPVISA